MWRRSYLLLAVLCVALLAPGVSSAQQAMPDVYTYVAEWAFPPAQWEAFTALWEKNFRPVLERFSADGTLMSWGTYATVVHEPQGMTHGLWFQANSIAALERVRTELVKSASDPVFATAVRHRDYLLRSLVHQGRSSKPGAGYLGVASFMVKPGQGEAWRQLWDKHVKPTYDQLLANGTITLYQLDVEQVHTEDPGLRFIAYVAPNAEAVDKVRAAIGAMFGGWAPEVFVAFGEAASIQAHRDFFARVVTYWHK